MMDWGNVPDWLSLIVALAAVCYAYYGVKQAAQGAQEAIKQSNKTAQEAIKSKRLDYFSEYSKRYNELIIKLPADFEWIVTIRTKTDNTERYLFHELDGSQKQFNESQVGAIIVALFNLFSDEHYLFYEAKMVDKLVWRNWLDGIKMCLSYPAFSFVWTEIRESSIYGDDYRKFIDDIIKEIQEPKNA